MIHGDVKVGDVLVNPYTPKAFPHPEGELILVVREHRGGLRVEVISLSDGESSLEWVAVIDTWNRFA